MRRKREKYIEKSKKDMAIFRPPKALLYSVLTIVLLIGLMVMFGQTTRAATHTHSAACYNGTAHSHTGSSSSGGGCYGKANYDVFYCSGCYSYSCSGCASQTVTTYCSGCKAQYSSSYSCSGCVFISCDDNDPKHSCPACWECPGTHRDFLGYTCPGHRTTQTYCPGHTTCYGHSYIYSYSLNCGKTAGAYYNSSGTQVSAICSTVVTKVTLTKPTQTLTYGVAGDYSATITFLDGSTATATGTCDYSTTNTNFNTAMTYTVSFSQYNKVNTASNTATPTATVTITTTPLTYTVSYNANGGSGAPSSQTKTQNTKLTLSSTKPSRTGYTFNNWNTAADGSGTVYGSGTTYSKNEALTLYAQWTANTYTINYNGNGNTGGDTASSSHTYDTAKTLTSNGFSRIGYTFAGWNTASDGSGTGYTNGQSVKNLTGTADGSVTLYAQWTANTYTVSYDGNGSTGGAMTSSTHTYDVKQALNMNGYEKSGYAFDSWNTDPEGGGTRYSDGEEVMNLIATNGGNVILYAQWIASTYTVTYDGNGNTDGSMADSIISYQQETSLRFCTFTKDGYVFIGWNTAANGSGTSYVDCESVLDLGDIVLYAQWAAEEYSITYVTDGGVLPGDTSYSYTVETETTLPEPIRENATFIGWYETSDYTGGKVTSTAGVIGNKFYYAKWEYHTYTITFNGNGATGGLMGSRTFTYYMNETLPENLYEREGYLFVRWNTAADGSGESFGDQAMFRDLGNIVLYAQWDTHSYESVVYNRLDNIIQDQKCDVSVTRASAFSVSIPKTVTMEGTQTSSNTAAYSVVVQGDIPSMDRISVTPVGTFEFTQQEKKSVTATVVQDQTEFYIGAGGYQETDFNEGIQTEGTILATGLSAGKWTGHFNFRVDYRVFAKENPQIGE